MREIRLSGSGEGLGWATAQPTLQAIFVSAGADLLSTPVELSLPQSVLSLVVPHEGDDHALLPHTVCGCPLRPARRQPGGLASHPPSLGARLGASAHAGRFYGEGACPRAAARRTGGAGMTADSPASPSTGRERGHHRRRPRPWLVGTDEPVRSRRGLQHPRRGQVGRGQSVAAGGGAGGAGGCAPEVPRKRPFKIPIHLGELVPL